MQMTFRRVLTACALVAGLSAPAAAAETFVYANYMAEQYTLARTDNWMLDEIERRSNGEIKFERYFSGTLLKAPDLYPGLQSGAADIVSGTPSAYNRADFRLSNVVLPYISSDAVAISAALNELWASNEAFQQEYLSRNAHLLYAVPWAENTFWGNKPIATIEDFKGLRVRAVQSIAATVEKMGGTPVTMTWPEAVEALGRGVVDVVSSAPFDSAVLGNIYESARYGSDGGDMGIFSFAAVSMNQERWESLTDRQRAIFQEVAAQAPAKFLEFLDEELQKSADRLCAYEGDLKITPFSPEQAKKAHDTIGAELQTEWVAWAAETTDVDTAAFLQQYVDLVHKNEAGSTWRSGFERLDAAGCKVR